MKGPLLPSHGTLNLGNVITTLLRPYALTRGLSSNVHGRLGRNRINQT